MAVIPTINGLETVARNWMPVMRRSSVRMYDDYAYDYGTIYRTQPNVRTCVDFLARNIAHLGLHVFRRLDDGDRQRLRDHPLAQTIARPMPPEYKVSTYRLIESLVADLGVYFNAYWLKVRTGDRLGLLRIPPYMVTVEGALYAQLYKIDMGGKQLTYAPDTVVHFRGYNPESASFGLSPLETLRRILAEEHAAGDYREHFWANAARMHGVIERPAEAPEWGQEARERFLADFASMYAGSEGSGQTAVLEEGMSWKQAEFTPQDSEYLSGRKLTREECARAYHIPPPLVGILDHATFSNIKEQHKSLYTDTLGPWLGMIEQDVDLQLVPEFEDVDGVYVEFNVMEKLQGDFEEQTLALQSAVGRPWMTPNEARGRLNLQRLEGDADELATPLNVLIGGQASPRDSAPPVTGTAARKDAGARKDVDGLKADGELDGTLAERRERYVEQWRQLLIRHFGRQRDALVARLIDNGELAVLWQGERWDRELSEDLFKLNVDTATAWGRYVAEQLESALDEARMYAWLKENARIAAEEINASTYEQVAQAVQEPEVSDALKAVFLLAETSRAQMLAESRVTTASNFGAQEAAKQGGIKTKTWVVNSGNPRSIHAAMNGETVPIGTRFSNGMQCPGDPAGGVENNSNCRCSLRFGR